MGQQPFHFIWEAEWYDIADTDYPLTPERWVRESFHHLIGTQVDCLTYNLWSSDHAVAQLNSSEIPAEHLDRIEKSWVWRTRENVRKLIAAGANPPDMAVTYGRKLGIPVIPILRMNDEHDHIFPTDVTKFKRENPHLLLGYTGPAWEPYWSWGEAHKGHPDPYSIDSFTWGMFDFAHKEVRDHKMAVIEEFITRWDHDGIDLDFERSPRFFREYSSPENAELMTDLVRQTRDLLDRAANQRGKPQYLIVRVQPKISVCNERCLDVQRWVNEGLVDVVIAGQGGINVSQDLTEWQDLVTGSDCLIFTSNNHWKTTEETRGWAKLMYQRRTDGLVLFNYNHLLHGFDKNSPVPKRTLSKFDTMGTVWLEDLHPEYYRVLNEIGDVETLRFKDCCYSIESAPRGKRTGWDGDNARLYWGYDDIPLPIELQEGIHKISFGFADDLKRARELGMSPKVRLLMKIFNYTEPDDFDVYINGALLSRADRASRAVFIMEDDTWITYPDVPGAVFELGENDLEIRVNKLNPEIILTPRLDNLEIRVEYG